MSRASPQSMFGSVLQRAYLNCLSQPSRLREAVNCPVSLSPELAARSQVARERADQELGSLGSILADLLSPGAGQVLS